MRSTTSPPTPLTNPNPEPNPKSEPNPEPHPNPDPKPSFSRLMRSTTSPPTGATTLHPILPSLLLPSHLLPSYPIPSHLPSHPIPPQPISSHPTVPPHCRTDGILDHLLPDTTLHVELADTRRDAVVARTAAHALLTNGAPNAGARVSALVCPSRVTPHRTPKLSDKAGKSHASHSVLSSPRTASQCTLLPTYSLPVHYPPTIFSARRTLMTMLYCSAH
jgi:hypothetical protein